MKETLLALALVLATLSDTLALVRDSDTSSSTKSAAESTSLTLSPTGIDDTALINGALTRDGVASLGEGTFIISDEIVIPNKGMLLGIRGKTIIKAAETRKGHLATSGRYIHIPATTSHSLVDGIKFLPAANMINFEGGACIRIQGADNIIQSCLFEALQDYGEYREAIRITGETAVRNKIISNKVFKSGITVENGASYNEVLNNEIIEAPYNAIGFIGNHTSVWCFRNLAQGNIIKRSGRMGIEDQQKCDSTMIVKNVVEDSGRHPAFKDAFIGISAVARNPIVFMNTVQGFASMGIELNGNNGGRCTFNTVINPVGDAIFANYTTVLDSANLALGVTISNNNITGCNYGVTLFGNHSMIATVTYNTFVDVLERPVSMTGAVRKVNVNVSHNKFYYNKPATVNRSGIVATGQDFTEEELAKEPLSSKILINDNYFYFHPDAAGGTGWDTVLRIAMAGANITNNRIDANYIRNASGALVRSLSYDTPSDVFLKLHDNDFQGCLTSLRNLTSPPEMSGNNFSDIAVQGTLPVDLISFVATPMAAEVVLRWRTATEKNNAFFTVERSADGKTFEEVTRVKGRGTSSSIRYYEATDLNPLTGTSYYRLRQTDNDGAIQFSAVVSVIITGRQKQDISVFPNPFDGTTITIALPAATGNGYEVSVVDMQGRTIYTTSVAGTAANPSFKLEPAQKLKAGVYVVTASGSNGSFSKKLVVQ